MKKKYIIRYPEQLNLEFYKGFHEDFLYNKAFTLWAITEKQEKFFELAEIKPDDKNEVAKYLQNLNAEIYFTEMHQAEALFALMFALSQGLPHWLYLSTYKTIEIKEGICDFIKEAIEKITFGKLKTLKEYIDYSIYFNFKPLDEKKAKNWDKNIENAIWLLKRIGERYLEADEYNAYKHGLRVFTGETAIFVSPSDSPGKKTCLAHSKNSFNYLQIKDKGEGGLTVFKTIKHFNPVESLNYLFVMRQMLETIKTTRLARLLRETDKVKINTFFEIDKKGFQELARKTIISVTA